MLQEGYMMKTSSFAGAQYQIKTKIEALVGTEKTAEFYDAWLDQYIQKVDVDSLKAWGFNSIRLPMHYNLYTLPIEDEPVKGENTWLDKGFALTDQLLQWCAENEMYLILDLHATPGGQGKDAGISDYNPGKPSLWESATNRAKTVALWKKLAERYGNDPWIGGYDLINETNWTMSNNKPLKDIYIEITKAIRGVDKNHIIFIEGNWFANDFTGLTPPWDNNMVYSFHKYWSYNDQASIQWMLDMRNQYNIPIWCGEAGENSNVWFTDAIKLFEKNNIGWAWWPYKKIEEIDGPLSIVKSSGYDRILNYWSGLASKPTVDFAANALMELAGNLKLENCIFQNDVVDAMFRQVQDVATKPFVRHDLPGLIFATEYDLGSNGYAYADNQVADYHVSSGTYTSWNDGWVFRNDGVDIEACSDNAESNGYNVGWIVKDEWLAYTVNIDETAAYDFSFRIASGTTAGLLHVELDNQPVSTTINLKNTLGWQNWATVKTSGIILEQGHHLLKLYFETSDFNLNFFDVYNPTPTQDQKFSCLAVSTSNDGLSLIASLNKKLAEPLPEAPGGFSVRTAGKNIPVNSYKIDATGFQIILALDEPVFYEDRIFLSYAGNAVNAVDATALMPFSDLRVKNTLESRQSIPGQIQAENFDVNNGFSLENTTDSGGGQDLGWSDAGDYVDYLVTINSFGTYNVDYRIASESSGGRVDLLLIDDNGSRKIHSAAFPATGGWQAWRTVTQSAVLPQGRFTLRIKVTQSGFNLNWVRFQFVTEVDGHSQISPLFTLSQNYPNPFNPSTTIRFSIPQPCDVTLKIYNILGKTVETLVKEQYPAGEFEVEWNAANYSAGLYFYQLQANGFTEIKSLILLK